MSITDDARPDSRPQSPSGGKPSGGRPPGAGGPPPQTGGFDKSPPQDIAAEQSVLGGMLLSKDAIADVVEIHKSHDFYRPVHATVFDTILELYGRGEPADGVTVAAAGVATTAVPPSAASRTSGCPRRTSPRSRACSAG